MRDNTDILFRNNTARPEEVMDSNNPPTTSAEQVRCFCLDTSVLTTIEYLGGTTPADAMFDQLAFLLSHVTTECTRTCPECERLENVKHWLLAPFDSAVNSIGNRSLVKGP